MKNLIFNTKTEEYDKVAIRYLMLKRDQIIDLDPLVRRCPRLNCGKFVRADNNRAKKVTCDCGQEICFKCGGKFHDRCDQRAD